MSLNIKNPRVHELAREAARRTGKTQTGVIEVALEQFLASLPPAAGGRDRAELLRVIQAEVAAGPPLDPEDLYDAEAGLPR